MCPDKPDAAPLPFPRAVTDELLHEFRHCDPEAATTIVKLYEACWYLEAHEHPEEAQLCAMAIAGLRKSLLGRPPGST